MKLTRLILLFLHHFSKVFGCIIAFTLLVSCGEEETKITKVKLFLYDSPFSIDSAFIDIRSITFVCDSPSYEQTIKLRNTAGINLVDYTNGKDTLLTTLFLPVCNISKYIVTFGSRHTIYNQLKKYEFRIEDTIHTFALKKPIKLLEENDNLYLDFDCMRSLNFIKEGDKTFIKFNPELTLRSSSNTGSIKGFLKNKNTKTFLWAVSLDDTIGTIATNKGDFLIRNLPEGTYQLIYFNENLNFEVIINSVKVEPNKITGVGTIYLN